MNILAYAVNQLALWRKNRELAKLDHFIWAVEDQVHSGAKLLAKLRERRNQIEAEKFALEPPDEIVRRSGAGA